MNLPLVVVNGYLAVLTAAAIIHRIPARAAAPVASRKRYAVLVPAHNEAAVIAAAVSSVVHASAGRATVHVVADNCTDDTVSIARRLGADVHERVAPADPGKGPALRWLVEQLGDRGDRVDAFVVMDADTVMAPGFFEATDAALADPARNAWQGYYAVAAPETSPAVATRYAAIALRHHVRPLGRTALGGSCGLFGNAMVFRPEVLAGRGFSDHLTEDAEMQVQLLLDGELVGFVPEARVEAEMPATMEAARTQHARWELGRAQVARRYVPELLRAIPAGRVRRIALVDAVLDQLVPPLSALAAATAAGAMLGAATGRRSAPVAVAGTSIGLLSFHVVAGLRVAGAPASVWRGLVHAPRLVVWKLGLLLGVVRRPDDVDWRRTARNADVGEEVSP